jgi:hypothetical protein
LVVPECRDPDEAAKVTHLNEILADATAIILAEDECDMMLLPILRATWHRRDVQPRVLTPGQNCKRPVFGTVNLHTGAWHNRLTDRKCSVGFIATLTELLTTYPAGRIYLLVDSGSIHTGKAVQQWLNGHDRLQLVYLPAMPGTSTTQPKKSGGTSKMPSRPIAASNCSLS